MSENYESPNPNSIADLFEIIFGEDIGVTNGGNVETSDRHIATFLNTDDELVAVCACDTPFVTYSGAALSMIPAAVANEMISDGELTETIQDNFYEVMNICSKLMMSDNSAHLRLDKVVTAESLGDTFEKLQGNSESLEFAVDIPGYGKGALGFLIRA